MSKKMKVIPYLNLYLFREMLTQSHSPMYKANRLISDCVIGFNSDQH